MKEKNAANLGADAAPVATLVVYELSGKHGCHDAHLVRLRAGWEERHERRNHKLGVRFKRGVVNCLRARAHGCVRAHESVEDVDIEGGHRRLECSLS